MFGITKRRKVNTREMAMVLLDTARIRSRAFAENMIKAGAPEHSFFVMYSYVIGYSIVYPVIFLQQKYTQSITNEIMGHFYSQLKQSAIKLETPSVDRYIDATRGIIDLYTSEWSMEFSETSIRSVAKQFIKTTMNDELPGETLIFEAIINMVSWCKFSDFIIKKYVVTP